MGWWKSTFLSRNTIPTVCMGIIGNLLSFYKLPPRLSKGLLFTVSIWKITATGRRTIRNMADNVGTAWRGSYPFFLWYVSSRDITW
jgi:hypothetical protein